MLQDTFGIYRIQWVHALFFSRRKYKEMLTVVKGMEDWGERG